MNQQVNRFLKRIILILFLSFAFEDVLEGSSQYPVGPPPVFSSSLYPCSQCHAYLPKDPRRRDLKFHQEILIKGHAEEQRWCLDCHDLNDRDKLRLINGRRIGFDNSYLLCGQCHGNIYRDWRVGVHGKRIGMWDGPKQYFLCPSCHNPHSPRFRQLKPEPPPLRPERTLR